MNVLSLFNGIGCAAYSLKKVGIPIENLYVSEIDKYANIVNDKNHPESVQLGCVKALWERRFDSDVSEILGSIDLLVGGSPCTGFSSAGKGKNFDDPQSSLFFYFVDILDRVKELNPNVKFMLENVKMKKEWRDIISGFLGVEPVFINSALVCAQNRQRWYWANWEIPQPEDRFIFLKDIIQPEEEIGEKYYLSEVAKARLVRRMNGGYSAPRLNPEKTGAMSTVNNAPRAGFDSGTTIVCHDLLKLNVHGGLKSNQEKASDICGGAHSGGNHSDMDVLAIYQRGRGFNKGGMHEDKSPPLTSNSWQNNHSLLQDYSLRRLAEIECERLQGLEDRYTEGISSTQRYKCLGNGWQCDTICHIFEHLKNLGK